MSTLRLIKYTNSSGELCKFRLTDKVCAKWRKFGLMLNITSNILHGIDSQMRGHSDECFARVMQLWLDGDSRVYPPTWEGMYQLLEDINLSQVARDLKIAVDHQNLK